MPDFPSLPPKQDVARGLLLKGSMFVHLDPRKEGVAVPNWLREHSQLVLQMGLDMPIPIVDLRVDQAGVFGTLSFNRHPFTCVVPWDAIFALVGDDGKGMVWPESMPPEIAAEVNQGAKRAGLHSVPPPGAESEDHKSSRRPAQPRRTPSVRPSLVPQESRLGAGMDASPPPPVGLVRAPGSGVGSTRPTANSKRPLDDGKPRKLPPYLRVVK